ncbi:Mediator of RNA polymerase II transcription subunit 17 [Camellia lanceoleosa]|uniref:Mediator of RNA polymerase II transcription subunit 17 n=1 Tax=Camellia lanceoleosa TaxID=1840588 RepID=A0ACC0IA00_9ERIC|nr:Mediator of RNA polymerase II transcription subunit 17 [Camellia lanceoleosa]
MVENLQLAHQELPVIIDLINTVEANDAVTVAGMTRRSSYLMNYCLTLLYPQQQSCNAPHLGKYFKLICQSIGKAAVVSGPSAISTVRVEYDPADNLVKTKPLFSEDLSKETKKEPQSDDECVKETHSILREVHHAIFDEQVAGVPYVQLISHPTWHSRTSSWTISMNVPQSILHAGCQTQNSGIKHIKDVKSQFRTKVVVNDDFIYVEGEGAPNVVALFKSSEASAL